MSYIRYKMINGCGPYAYEEKKTKGAEGWYTQHIRYIGKTGAGIPAPTREAGAPEAAEAEAETAAVVEAAPSEERPTDEWGLETLQREAEEVTGKPFEEEEPAVARGAGEKSGLEILQEEAAEVTGKPKEEEYEEKLKEIQVERGGPIYGKPRRRARPAPRPPSEPSGLEAMQEEAAEVTGKPPEEEETRPKPAMPAPAPRVREKTGIEKTLEGAEEGYTPPEEPEEEEEEEPEEAEAEETEEPEEEEAPEAPEKGRIPLPEARVEEGLAGWKAGREAVQAERREEMKEMTEKIAAERKSKLAEWREKRRLAKATREEVEARGRKQLEDYRKTGTYKTAEEERAEEAKEESE